MYRRALTAVSAPVGSWRSDRARQTLANLDAEHATALPEWLNKIAADVNKREKEHKLVRAHRRGLLHLDRPQNWGYPSNWNEVASTIRLADHFQCVVCGADNIELHVHHIVYLSNFGTHRKENLVSLCRPCHEEEHEREFDFGEQDHATTAQAAT